MKTSKPVQGFYRNAAIGLAGAAVLFHAAPATATQCTDLANISLTLDGVAQTVSLTAQDVAAGNGLPAYCDVSADISSNGNANQSQIAIEVWLPETGWNGRFLGTGNGGFAGAISTASLELGISQGYATANTDLGTGILFKCNTLFCGSAEGVGEGVPLGGLYEDAAAITDFGYGATHLMTLAGRQLTQAYYTKAAKHSYFDGCSTGGQQALMEAQRYPADYNGILAGSPAYDRTHLHISSAAVYEITHFAPDALLTAPALTLLHQGVLAQCAGKDGGLATDDFLTQPSICKFNATALQCNGTPNEVPCTPNAQTCTCVTPDQAVAANADWTGALDNDGNTLYPGYERGTEEPAAGVLLESESLSEPLFDSLEYWAFGPNWTWQSLFANTNTPQGELIPQIEAADNTAVGASTFAGVLNANSADLSNFNTQGDKLLMYAGYADPLIPSASTIDYYNAVAAQDGNLGSYLRLFLAPGMWHCGSGPGVNAFGNLGDSLPPVPGDPRDDVLAALVKWVEKGVAPTKVIGTKYVDDNPSQGIAFQRPLCLYPANARYDTKKNGDPTLATSYVCKAGSPVTNQEFSPGYGPN